MSHYLLVAVTFLSVIFTQDDCNIPGTVLDDCNICVGGDSCFDPIISPSQFRDCDGVCFGDAYLDNCDVCDNDPSNDCNYLLGDLNGDGSLNVLDAVQLVAMILEGTPNHSLGDLNGDGSLNVLDVVMMVNIITSPPMIFPSGTLTIQEAIDIAAQDGRNLVFVNPLSNYYVDATIKIPSNIEIDFNGAIITRSSFSNPPFFNIIENSDTTTVHGLDPLQPCNPNSANPCGNSNIVIKK